MIWLLMGVFLGMMVFPLGYASFIANKYEADNLVIQQEKMREMRYFGQAFAKMIRAKVFGANKPLSIRLRREEALHYTLESGIDKDVYENIIIIEETLLEIPEYKKFYNEIYAKHNVCLKGHTYLRALYAEGKMIIGCETKVKRWLDAAGTVVIYDNCDLGISTTSGDMLSIGKNCIFRRLYAPMMFLGQYPDTLMEDTQAEDGTGYVLKEERNEERNIRFIKDEMVNEDGVIPYTIITDNDLVVTENLVIEGDVRSSKGIRLCDGVVICGNLFSENDILIGRNCRVLGNIFTQGSILIEEGVVIGQRDRIISVVARDNIVIKTYALVYGYIGCEGKGEVWPLLANENFEREYQMKFSTNDRKLETLVFPSVEDYERAALQGYRHCTSLKRVVIPHGVKVIYKGMFYGCTGIEEMILPDTIEVIEPYAFAGCNNMKAIDLKQMKDLREIGDYAFETWRTQENFFVENMLSIKIQPEDSEQVGNDTESINKVLTTFTSVTKVYGSDIKNGVGKEVQRQFRKVKTEAEQRQLAFTVAGIGIVCTFLIGTVGVVHYQNVKESTMENEAQVDKRMLYTNQGLPGDTVLDDVPKEVTKGYVAYTDRVLKRYISEADVLAQQGDMYQALSDFIPEGISQSAMLVPLRIQYEESASIYKGNVEKDVAYIKNALPDSMQYIDLFEELKPYKDRYIFYRTLPYWTSEGAYYSASAFMSQMGMSLPDLTTYDTHLYASIPGYLYTEAYPFADFTKDSAQDQLYYYTLPLASTWQTIYRKVHGEQWVEAREPIMSKSRGGMNTFIGGLYAHSVMDGSVVNGKCILVLGDTNANLLAPYFLSGYEKVVVVNQLYFADAYDVDTSNAFLNLFEQYQVTDFLHVQGVDRLSDRTAVHTMEDLLGLK